MRYSRAVDYFAGGCSSDGDEWLLPWPASGMEFTSFSLVNGFIGWVAGLSTALAPPSTVGGGIGPGPGWTGGMADGAAGESIGGAEFVEDVDGGAVGDGCSPHATRSRAQTAPLVRFRRRARIEVSSQSSGTLPMTWTLHGTRQWPISEKGGSTCRRAPTTWASSANTYAGIAKGGRRRDTPMIAKY